MAADVYNVWDAIYSIMCVECKYHDYCHGEEVDDANDQQMVMCMLEGQVIRVNEQKVKREDIIDPLGE